jgi:hypothetical protein
MKTVYRILLILALAFSVEGKFSRKSDRVIDLSQTVPLSARRTCDGYSSPEDHPAVKASFSDGGWDRSFTVSVFQKSACKVDVKVKCLDTRKEGWRDVWTIQNTDPSKSDLLSLRSCYAWGTSEAAQYVLSGWYREGSDNPKLPWKQAPLKKLSSSPDVYEFSDTKGGTARLTLSLN